MECTDAPVEEGLLGGGLDRKGDGEGVLIEFSGQGRGGEVGGDGLAAIEDDLGPAAALHGVLWGDGGSAEVPAALDVEAEFEAEAGGLAAGVGEEFLPFG